MHQHPPIESCPTCEAWPVWARYLIEGITVMSALSDAVASLEAKVDQALALLSHPNPDVQAAIDSLNAEGAKVDTAVAADTPAAPAAPAAPASPADTNAPAPSGNEIPAPVDPNAPSA